jgi:DNA adenine methylase
MESGQRIKPFLKWAGSKKQILSTLASYWSNEFNSYVEPFVGSGSLYFYLTPQKAILGDINSELIATYRQIKNDFNGVSSNLSKMVRDKDEYYRIRALDVKTLSPSQRAARFIYLNRLSFNGLYRTNQKGEFNVPFGGEKSGSLPNQESLQACSIFLQRTILVSGDFELVLEKTKSGDFVYLDPPYSVKARRIFNEYDRSGFNENDIKRLKQWLEKLTTRGVVFLLSYAKSSEAKFLMDGYPIQEITVRRNIAGFSEHRHDAKEWIASNMDSI